MSLGEGMTPLLPMPRLDSELGLPGLLMKDDSALPTATFKARGAAVGVSSWAGSAADCPGWWRCRQPAACTGSAGVRAGRA